MIESENRHLFGLNEIGLSETCTTRETDLQSRASGEWTDRGITVGRTERVDFLWTGTVRGGGFERTKGSITPKDNLYRSGQKMGNRGGDRIVEVLSSQGRTDHVASQELRVVTCTSYSGTTHQ